MKIRNAARLIWVAGALLISASALVGFAGQKKFDKATFLARPKWYMTFTVRLKGQSEVTKTHTSDQGYYKAKWDILREVSGTEILDLAMPGKWPISHPPSGTSGYGQTGRYIGWADIGASGALPTPAEIVSGQMKMAGNGMFLPVTYTVKDLVQSENLDFEGQSSSKTTKSKKITGGGTAYLVRGAMFTCDLGEMRFDLILDRARTASGGFRGDTEGIHISGEKHYVETPNPNAEDTVLPPEQAKPDKFLPGLTETLKKQLAWRELELTGDRIEFTASEPVNTMPFGLEDVKMADGKPLELSIDIILSPHPPSDAQLVLKPVDYEKWRPRGSASETVKGNDLTVQWRVEDKGGDPAKPPKLDKITFSLLNTSKQPGVCMNWPLLPKDPPDFDLKFHPPAAPVSGRLISADGQHLTLTGAQLDSRKGDLAIDSFDFGGTAALTAEAVLTDGRVLKTVIEKAGGSQLSIPDVGPGSSIARAWHDKYAAGKGDDADDENDPVGDGQVGDGLTVYEEYRGFWIEGQWDGTCDPRKKDLFIYNKLGWDGQNGIWLFHEASKLAIHDRIQFVEVRGDRVINFNKGSGPHVADQHLLVLCEGGGKTEHEIYSICNAVPGAGFPGPPKNTLDVELSRGMLDMNDKADQVRSGETYEVSEANATVAHELGHGIGIYHHGDNENDHDLTYQRLSTGELVMRLDGVVVKVILESTGQFAVPSQLFGADPPGSVRSMWIGERQGQHSGDEACIMRYDCAVAYRSLANRNILIYHGGPEVIGVRFCTSPAGTGKNMPTHEPQSRYGGAGRDRGDCTHKFVVSDRWEKIHH